MNLHAIAAGAIGAVNPFISATFRASTGYTTNPAGKRTPTYAPDVTIRVQVQALTWKDLQQVDGLNLQGEKRAIYADGDIEGIVRSTGKGGDLIIIASGSSAGTWLVAQVLEVWPDWCKVAATLQNGA